MSVNVPLLRKMVEWVEEQEQLTEGRKWRQMRWVETVDKEPYCGTTYCVAGKLVIDHGWAFTEEDPETVARVDSSGRYVERDIVTVACDILGMEPTDAQFPMHPLFDGFNTAADIRRIAEDIAGERL